MHTIDPQSMLRLDNSNRNETDDRRYSGMSGACYKYDLSKPVNQLHYSIDPGIQLRDSINSELEMDRSMGQYGGDIQP